MIYSKKRLGRFLVFHFVSHAAGGEYPHREKGKNMADTENCRKTDRSLPEESITEKERCDTLQYAKDGTRREKLEELFDLR